MTDRYNALTVVLDRDMRSDDAKAIIAAIAQLRGVLSVTPHVVSGIDGWVAGERVRRELAEKLWAVLQPEPAP